MVKFPEPSNKAARTGLVITEYITVKNAKQVGKLLHHGPLFWAESKKGPRLLQANAAVKYRCDLACSFAAHKGVGSEFYLQDKKRNAPAEASTCRAPAETQRQRFRWETRGVAKRARDEFLL
jgi:hypothetical protein